MSIDCRGLLNRRSWERYPDESPFMAIKHCDDAGVL